MVKRTIVCFIAFMLFCSACCVAEPVDFEPDFSGDYTFCIYQDRDHPVFHYSYSYPKLSDNNPCAGDINAFYQYIVDDTMNFGLSMDLEACVYNAVEEDCSKEVTYEVTCNNGSYLGFLIHETSRTGTEQTERLYGHSFAVASVKGGSTLSLPYLIGLLSYESDYDEWLEERQTEKADQTVRDLVWDRIMEEVSSGALQLLDEADSSYLEDVFYPEEDFYLDEDGNPVFFIYPGRIADESRGFLYFPISTEEIEDEL